MHKPLEIYSVVVSTIKPDQVPVRDCYSIYFRPIGVVPLIIIAPGLFFATFYGAHLGRAAAAAFVMILFALVSGLTTR